MKRRITSKILREKLSRISANYSLDHNTQGYRLCDADETRDFSDRLNPTEMWYYLSGMERFKESLTEMLITFFLPSISDAAQLGHTLLTLANQHPQLQDIGEKIIEEVDTYENEASNTI